MIISQHKRLRRDYAPLVFSASVKCTSGASPTAQVYDALCEDGAQHSPDRTITPVVLVPTVVASASDGSFDSRCVNGTSECKWYVNGVDITAAAGWTQGAYPAGNFTIDKTATEARGTLTIWRNMGVGEQCELRFKAEMNDPRMGYNVLVESDPVVLSTTAKSGDSYALDIEDGDVLFYNPVEDRLALDDYKKATGRTSLGSSDRAIVAAERTSYLRRIPLRLRRGATRLTSGSNVTMKTYSVNPANGALTEMKSADISELTKFPSLAADGEIDMRLLTRGCYMTKAFVNGIEVGRRQFMVKRVEDDLAISSVNSVDLCADDIRRVDEAVVTRWGKKVECPERFIDIKWITSTSTYARKEHNIGRIGVMSLAEAGVSASAPDLEVWQEAEFKPHHSIAVDKTGVTYIDKASGAAFIFV